MKPGQRANSSDRIREGPEQILDCLLGIALGQEGERSVPYRREATRDGGASEGQARAGLEVIRLANRPRLEAGIGIGGGPQEDRQRTIGACQSQRGARSAHQSVLGEATDRDRIGIGRSFQVPVEASQPVSVIPVAGLEPLDQGKQGEEVHESIGRQSGVQCSSRQLSNGRDPIVEAEQQEREAAGIGVLGQPLQRDRSQESVRVAARQAEQGDASYGVTIDPGQVGSEPIPALASSTPGGDLSQCPVESRPESGRDLPKKSIESACDGGLEPSGFAHQQRNERRDRAGVAGTRNGAQQREELGLACAVVRRGVQLFDEVLGCGRDWKHRGGALSRRGRTKRAMIGRGFRPINQGMRRPSLIESGLILSSTVGFVSNQPPAYDSPHAGDARHTPRGKPMDALWNLVGIANDILWHDFVLYALLAVGVLFTFWSRFCQYRALTHGVSVVRGKYDHQSDPGAINHFQALSAALSATVGLGNIGGVALAISLGGPGAVFWMWVVGVLGMAIKTTEVSLSMLYRHTEDPENPHGGPMWVAKQGFAELGFGGVGKVIGGIFCVTLLASTVTGGAMFQAWNTADVTEFYFGIPSILTGIIMALIVGAVIIGGIKRIGATAGRIVPFMCLAYLLAALYVILTRITDVPEVFRLIFSSAFSPTEASGAFLGGAFGYAFYSGMKRALFSSEAGQGSSPIAHSAAKTDEPVREGVVAGLEPFIDTIVVCTLTAMVILLSGVWNRGAEATFSESPAVVQSEEGWALEVVAPPPRTKGEWVAGEKVFVILEAAENADTENKLHKLEGVIAEKGSGLEITWSPIESDVEPKLHEAGLYATYTGATLTARAFDEIQDGLGKWLVTMAAWLFALSTMISWSYYGEQGVVYLFGERAVLPYKGIFCLLVVVTCVGFIKTDQQLDMLTTLGTGVMLFANVPIMLIFGRTAMTAYHRYMGKLKSGEMVAHEAPPIQDVVEGHDHDPKS